MATQTKQSLARRWDDYQPSKSILEAEENRFEQIRKTAAKRHKKSDTDGTRRRARQTAEENRLI